jgi:proteasome accessory factor A
MKTRARLPKILGADVELGNFLTGAADATPAGTGALASRLLLHEIDGIATRNTAIVPIGAAGAQAPNPQDVGRRFLATNGGCAYIDSDHLEIAIPEVQSARDAVTYWRAMLQVATTAMVDADKKLPDGVKLQVLANCSDGLGQSYGAHTNVMLTHQAWTAITARKAHVLAYLAAFHVSSIVYTGQGKVGSENGRPAVAYQIAQRADFFETLVSAETMRHRPIVNRRDEPLCGDGSKRLEDADEPARLHVIFYDSTLCDVATFLRTGTLQIIVAMIEAGAVNAGLALDDPLAALGRWSHDPSLTARARTVGGDYLTAVELQYLFLVAARAFADTGGFEEIVPQAVEIIAMWADTLRRLQTGDLETLGRRIDWVIKRQLLERTLAKHPSLGWNSPEIKHLDHLYASLDRSEGLYWQFEQAGLVDRLVSDEAVARAVCQPPTNTRAFARTQLLRRLAPTAIDRIDWNQVAFWTMDRDGRRALRTVHLDDPAHPTIHTGDLYETSRSAGTRATAIH